MLTIVVKAPSACTTAELERFEALVVAAGVVTTNGLASRIRGAEKLVYLFMGPLRRLQGIAAIKTPRPTYKNKVFEKAYSDDPGAGAQQAGKFFLELGWLYVLSEARGMGLSYPLIDAALTRGGSHCCQLFSTCRVDNIPCRHALEGSGFTLVGKPWDSTQGPHQLLLYLLQHPPVAEEVLQLRRGTSFTT